MRSFWLSAAVLAALVAGSPALATGKCAGNPNALGTSRTLTVDPQTHGRVGKMQYAQFPQLPLNEREVVLTFDDGPLPPYTDSILKTLAAECVKATFFSVGRQARQFPETLRRAYNEGHTIGTHSQNHPLTFDQMPFERAQREIDDGIASVSAAMGDPRALAPFFRIPGLLRVNDVENYLTDKGISVWSVDADADDWYKTATPETVVQKAVTRLNQRGRGILLLHDVQPVTALALPLLLRELKVNGYRVVHVVPKGKRSAPHDQRVATTQQDAKSWPKVTESTDRSKSKSHRRAPVYRYYYHEQPSSGFEGWQYFRR